MAEIYDFNSKKVSQKLEALAEEFEGYDDNQIHALYLVGEIERRIKSGEVKGIIAIGMATDGGVFSGHGGDIGGYFTLIGAMEDFKLYLRERLKETNNEDYR